MTNARPRLVSTLGTAALAAAAFLVAPATPASATPGLIPPVGTFLGAAVPPNNLTAFPALEGSVGRPLDMQRVYTFWDVPVPKQVTWDGANSVMPVLSIASTTSNGLVIPWSSIASGADDSAIVSQADQLKALDVPVLLSLDHEPEADTQNGTAAQYVAAFRHYVEVFRAQGASNVSFAVIMEARSFSTRVASSYYPGDAYVDWVGADGFNGYTCFPSSGGSAKWLSFASIFGSFYNFGKQHDKPMVIAEWASTEYPGDPSKKAAWITAAATTLKNWPAVDAALYFDAPGQAPTCQWPVNTSAQSLTAFTTMAVSKAFNPAPRPVLTSSASSGSAPLTVTFDAAKSIGMNHAIASWTLSFGDGSPALSGKRKPPSAAKHTYAAGTWTAELTVTDTVGESDFASQTVTVGAS
ncbi:MAG: PKD domain-containing protein [Acidimicrobiales bacterium]